MADLELHADLRCELDGQQVSVLSSQQVTAVDVETLSTLVQMGRLFLPKSTQGRVWLKRFLDCTGTTLDIRVRGRTVAVMGSGVRPGLVRLFGISYLRVHPIAITASMFGRNR